MIAISQRTQPPWRAGDVEPNPGPARRRARPFQKLLVEQKDLTPSAPSADKLSEIAARVLPDPPRILRELSTLAPGPSLTGHAAHQHVLVKCEGVVG